MEDPPSASTFSTVNEVAVMVVSVFAQRSRALRDWPALYPIVAKHEASHVMDEFVGPYRERR